MAADPTSLVILNADVRTMVGGDGPQQALAMSDGRVRAVGSNADIEGLAGRATTVLDAGGRTVLPGFIDAHTHLGLVAQSFAIGVDCRSPTVTTLAELLERAAARARTAAAGTWLLLQGTTFQDELVAERRFPTPEELNGISAEHPIVYRSSLHHTIANRRALELAGIDEHTPDPPSGRIERDANGRPTGVMAEMFDRFPIASPTTQELDASLTRVARDHYLANGVTAIQEIWDSPTVARSMADKVRSGEMPLRIRNYGWVPLAGSLEAIAGGDLGGVAAQPDWFEFGGVKLFADGGTSSHTAAFYEDYADSPGTRGELTYPAEELAALVRVAHEHDVQVLIHAAGDRAYDTALDAFEHAQAASPRPKLRHRIEHGANTAWSDERTQRCLRLGVLPVPNVGFIRTYGDFWEQALGAGRARPSIPLRTLIEAGLPVPGSSDTSGGDPSLLDPLRNMATALARRTLSGRQIDLGERLDVDQALVMYTRNAAYAGRWESVLGTLESGQLGDAVVLSRRIEDDASEPFDGLCVHHTIVAGRRVYTAPEDAAHDAIRRSPVGAGLQTDKTGVS